MENSRNVYINPETGEQLFRDVRRLEYEYKGIKFYVNMPGWYPKNNDEGIFTQDDMKVYDKALHIAKAETEHLLTPDQIKAVRRQLNLTQEAAGRILGVTSAANNAGNSKSVKRACRVIHMVGSFLYHLRKVVI